MDCMEGMKTFPDKYFDLAIVDPPYGSIAVFDNCQPKERKNKREKKYQTKEWDKQKPLKIYWNKLFRISKNQIVWGANYFVSNLYESRGWVYWDKNNGDNNFSDGELAWTSFDKRLLSYKISSKAETRGGKDRIHPTQKPVALYKWLLRNYAKPDFKIIDTHVGSGSSIIAFLDYGCEWIGFEIDEDYHSAATKRIEIHKKRPKPFFTDGELAEKTIKQKGFFDQ